MTHPLWPAAIIVRNHLLKRNKKVYQVKRIDEYYGVVNIITNECIEYRMTEVEAEACAKRMNEA